MSCENYVIFPWYRNGADDMRMVNGDAPVSVVVKTLMKDGYGYAISHNNTSQEFPHAYLAH